MKNILTFGLVTGALLFGATQAQAMSLVIDNFENTSTASGVFLTVNPVSTSDSDTEMGIAGVLGGTRSAELSFLDGDVAASAGINETFLISTGSANLSNNAGGLGTEGASSNLNLTYNGFGTTDLSPFDFAAVDIDLEATNDDFAAIGVSFTDGGGNVVSSTLDGRNGDSLLPSPTTLFFSNFTGDAGFDFADVTEISLDVSGFAEEDVVIDNFRVGVETTPEQTPEPAAVIGLFASLGFGALSKKKKQA